MFQELGASGIVLCYGPLALTIIGFIAFAYLTDNISTRTYLRNMDPRPEAEQGRFQSYSVKQPVQALTPAGGKVVLLPGESPKATDGVRAGESVKVAGADDLTCLEGIGPQIKSVLAAAGITTFAQVAASTPEALRAVLDKAGISVVHKTSSWPQQAALAAQGKWAELDALKANLNAGK
ncbi:MAG TPA: DUF4332 domain-containing protein [Anaerolineae bacterium]|nr:DUF4332 domain-containing protein [Anaerolineae bacterium]